MPRTRSRQTDDFIVPDEYGDPDELIAKIRGDEDYVDECDDEYLQSEYLTSEWKRDVKNPARYEQELQTLIREQRDSVPTVQTVLDADVSREEKKECLYLLDRLKNSDPYEDMFDTILKDLQRRLRPKSDTEKQALRLQAKQQSYTDRILALPANDAIKAVLLRYANSIGDDGDSHSKRTKLEGMLALPYDRVTCPDKTSVTTKITSAAGLLERELYGLEAVKRLFLSVYASSLESSSNDNPVIALVGPPGVGKTHISGLYAQVLGVPAYHVLLGGAKDSTILHGGDNMWQGSSCGQMARALQSMGVSDGVITIDEIDKCSHLDVFNALNHILDYSSNHQFRDEHYAEIPIDLSRVKFVVTMNDTSMLPEPLLDRLTIVRLDAYNHTDKQTIAHHYLLPRFLPNTQLSDAAIRTLVEATHESGVRDLKKLIQHISKKVSLHRVMHRTKSFAYTQLKHYSPTRPLSADDVKVLIADIVT